MPRPQPDPRRDVVNFTLRRRNNGRIVKVVTEDTTMAQTHESLGGTIRRAREAQGLNQSQLATMVGAHRARVLRWERGEDTPAPKYLIELARTLELRSADLFLLAGQPLPADAPSLPAMLRAEYDLPPEAIAEVQRSIERVAKKYARPEAKTAPKSRKEGTHDTNN